MSREKDLAGLVEQARRAYQSGTPVFAAKVKAGGWLAPDNGEIENFTRSIASVEQVGWRLEHWSVATDSAGTAFGYPVFRRDASLIQDQV